MFIFVMAGLRIKFQILVIQKLFDYARYFVIILRKQNFSRTVLFYLEFKKG